MPVIKLMAVPLLPGQGKNAPHIQDLGSLLLMAQGSAISINGLGLSRQGDLPERHLVADSFLQHRGLKAQQPNGLEMIHHE